MSCLDGLRWDESRSWLVAARARAPTLRLVLPCCRKQQAKMQELMKQFAQMDEQLEFKSEMMGDAIDDAVAEDGDEEEQEEILGKVFDELGFQFDREVPNAPNKDIAVPAPAGVEVRCCFARSTLAGGQVGRQVGQAVVGRQAAVYGCLPSVSGGFVVHAVTPLHCVRSLVRACAISSSQRSPACRWPWRTATSTTSRRD
jgi:hypothetical protein